jgi:hypothetical protein
MMSSGVWKAAHYVWTGLIFEITGLVSAMIIGMASICQQSAAIKRYSVHRAYSAQDYRVIMEVGPNARLHAFRNAPLAQAQPNMSKGRAHFPGRPIENNKNRKAIDDCLN